MHYGLSICLSVDLSLHCIMPNFFSCLPGHLQYIFVSSVLVMYLLAYTILAFSCAISVFSSIVTSPVLANLLRDVA